MSDFLYVITKQRIRKNADLQYIKKSASNHIVSTILTCNK